MPATRQDRDKKKLGAGRSAPRQMFFAASCEPRATERANHAIRTVGEIAKSASYLFSTPAESSPPPASTNFLFGAAKAQMAKPAGSRIAGAIGTT